MKSDIKIMPVVGVTFIRGYPANLHQLQALYDWQATAIQARSELGSMPTPEIEPLSVIIRHNSDNPHDSNAVQVYVPALGDEAFIGHFARANAVVLAPMLDEGVRFKCWVHKCRILQSDPSKPGIDIAIQRITKEVSHG